MYERNTGTREFILESDDIMELFYEFLASAPHDHIEGISQDDDVRLESVDWKNKEDRDILLTFTQ